MLRHQIWYIHPEVEYPSEPVAPTPPQNLVAILLAFENQDSEIPSPIYAEDASEAEADAEKQAIENHPAMQSPIKENQAGVLMVDTAVENPTVLDNSFDASS